MSISPGAALWVLSVMVLLTLIGAATVLLLQTRRQQGAVQARLSGVVTLHGPTRTVDARRRSRARRDQPEFVTKFLGFVGYNPERKAQYPLPWWVVVIVAIVVARVISFVGGLLVGEYAVFSMPLLLWFLARSYWRHYDNKRRKALYEQFPDALGSIVRAVRVGIPVSEALRSVSRDAAEPTATEFRHLSDQVWISEYQETE